MNEIELLLGKAERSLGAAERLLVDGDSDFAASRTYYAYFYVAEALLLKIGLEFSRHGQVLSQYGLNFAKTERLDPKYHRHFDRAFAYRQHADYDAAACPDPELVEDLISVGREFLRDAIVWIRANTPLDEVATE